MVTGPFAGKYKNNPYVYWFLWCFVITYVALVTVWVVIYVQNISIVHTWFKHPGMPGAELTSLRGSFTSVVLRIAIVIHPWVPFFVMFMIAYRKNVTLCIGAFVLMSVGFLLCFFAFTVLSDQYSHCNGQEQYGNLCNSLLWCCVNEIRSNPANMCPNTIDCATPLTFDDVRANPTFEGLYWIHVVLTMLQGMYIGMTFFIWYLPEEKEKVEEEQQQPLDTDEADPTPEDFTKTAPPVASVITQNLVGGLSRRRTTHRLKE